MGHILLFAVGASAPLLVGAGIGSVWAPSRRVLAIAMAFAAGALISAVAFELFQESYRVSGALVAGGSFALGAGVFVLTDTLIDHWVDDGSGLGFALLAGATIDGIPENAALGVTLAGGGSVALLVAIFVSNVPEGLGGALKMREAGRSRGRVLSIWALATAALAAAVAIGHALFASADPASLALPLGFAGGAVLASVVDAIAPEAYEDGGPLVALASAAGFITSFLLGH